MKNLLLFVFSFLATAFFGQTFLNGNFENNTAGNSDLINLSNTDCNLRLSDVNSFGTYGDVDIIRSASYGNGGPQNGSWYLGITGGGTDVIALTLSAPLVQGKMYSISYYDRKTSGYTVSPIQIGLSTSDTEAGDIVYTCPELAQLDRWTLRTFTFTAPNNGSFITVQMQSGDIQHWVNIDNFVFNNVRCGGPLQLSASSTMINKGNSVSLVVSGGFNYTWATKEALSAKSESIIVVNPIATTVYTVTSDQKECGILTATIAINVIQPIEQDPKDTLPAENKTEVIAQHKKPFHGKRVNGRKFIIQESITVSASAIKIMVWDKNRVDGDRVSIYVNGELIAEDFTVSKTKKEITVNLEPGKNIIVMHALNLGLVPPNTAALSINDGNAKAKLITLVSNLKKSGALEVIYDPLVYHTN